MNRKQKIILSVTGIFVVLLILVGLTYAYFLTRINGNTNTKSISASTKYLSVTYVDGTNTIATATGIGPSSTPVITKDFSVRNDGEDTSYVVIIENIDIKDKNNNTTTFASNDFTYVLECINSDDSSSCNDMGELKLPLSNGALSFNTIEEGVTQNFTLKIYYKETGIDQSSDMGKTISAKINISNGSDLTKLSDVIKLNNSPISTTRPNFANKATTDEGLIQDVDADGKTFYFRGAVKDNYVKIEGLKMPYTRIYVVGNEHLGPGITTPGYWYTQNEAEEDCNRYYNADYTYSSVNECIDNIKEELYEGIANTDYYLANEWVQDFPKYDNDDITWRIIRINGDGSIRLISEKSIMPTVMFSNQYSGSNSMPEFDDEKYIGYTYDNSAPNVQDGTDSNVKELLESWYDEYFTTYDRFIATTRFCNDTTSEGDSYSSVNREQNNAPSFICPSTNKLYGGEYRLKVGLMTFDEILYSGLKYHDGYNYLPNVDFWTMTPESIYLSDNKYSFNYIIGHSSGYYGDYLPYDLVPVINLKADTLFTEGNGTKTNPYVIK